jgi:hypothetical protein
MNNLKKNRIYIKDRRALQKAEDPEKYLREQAEYMRSYREKKNPRKDRKCKIGVKGEFGRDLYGRRLYGMIYQSRKKDEKRGIYDANNFIDRIFIEQLFFDQNQLCIYCNCELMMRCEPYSKNLLTVERIDNKVGHIKSNCVLACFECNNNRSDYHTFEEFKQMKSGK